MHDMEGQKSEDSQPVPAVNWSHVTGLIQPVEKQVERCLHEISELHVSQLGQVRTPTLICGYSVTAGPWVFALFLS